MRAPPARSKVGGSSVRPSRGPRAILGLRHTAASVMVGLLVWVVLPAIQGATAADGQEPTVPDQWSLPEMRPGDAGEYESAAGDSWFFEVQGPISFLDEDARVRTGFEIHTWSDDAPAQRSVFRITPDGTTHVSGSLHEAQEPTPCGSLTPDCSVPRRDELRSTLVHDEAERAAVPCGLANRLQGATISLVGTVFLSPDCQAGPQRTALHADAIQSGRTRGNERWIDFRALGPDAPVTLRFLASLPYPLLLDPDAEGPEPAMELTAFRRGEEADRSALVPLPGPVEPLQWAPRTEVGPSEAEMYHPFRLSDAVHYAKSAVSSDSGFRLYLASHQDAYVASAHYSEASDDARREYTGSWDIVASDGTSAYGVQVTRTWRQSGTLFSNTHEFRLTPLPASGPYPSPDALPAEMPTAVSLLEHWAAYFGLFVEPGVTTGIGSEVLGPDDKPAWVGGSAWGFRISCASGDCTRADVRYHAGIDGTFHRETPMTAGAAAGVRKEDLDLLSQLELGPDGRLHSLHRERSALTTWDGLVVDQPATRPRPALLAVTAIESDAASVAAAGAGLAALLATFAYWIWPLLREGFAFSFFSRIDKPKVLESRARADLFALIEAEPGIHFRELRRRLGRAHGTTMHHLRMLEANGLIQRATLSGKTCFFPGRVPPSGDVARALVASAPRVRLLRAVDENPDSSVADLARRLGVRRQSLHESVQRLGRDGLLDIRREGPVVRLALTPMARDALGATAKTGPS